MKPTININEPEFSRPIVVEKIPSSGMTQILEANAAERQRLVERFGLLELPHLKAELTVHSKGLDQSVAVTGKLIADIVQSCVVTLEPLPSHVEQNIDVLFVAPELMEAVADSAQVDLDTEDTETIIDGMIDLGELVAQHLGIAMDPYPRKPGAAFVAAEYGVAETPSNPFAQLINLPKKPKDSK
jgi:uncharacterized metal-binding protein YceD (DUF177 family)